MNASTLDQYSPVTTTWSTAGHVPPSPTLSASFTTTVNATTDPGQEGYDYRGATIFCVAVIVLYSFSLGAMVVTHIRRSSRSLDPGIEQYLKGLPSIVTEAERENRRRLRDVFILPHFVRNFQLPDEVESEADEGNSDPGCDGDGVSAGGKYCVRVHSSDDLVRSHVHAKNIDRSRELTNYVSRDIDKDAYDVETTRVDLSCQDNSETRTFNRNKEKTGFYLQDCNENSTLLEHNSKDIGKQSCSKQQTRKNIEKQGYSLVPSLPQGKGHEESERRSPDINKCHCDPYEVRSRESFDEGAGHSSDGEIPETSLSRDMACPSYEDVLKLMRTNEHSSPV